MESRFATTITPRSIGTPRSARSTGRTPTPSDKSLAASRNTISSQLMNVYYQQKDIALNMFDEWSHEQKINFLLSLMPRANYRQLVHVINWFGDNIPVWSLDFTTTLPRFLSLYIFSFLDTKSLARAASVCWRWKFLAEQDVLWRSRCVKLGWQLPFFPTDNEYGAWKKYFAKNYVQLYDLGLATPNIDDLHPVFFNNFDANHSVSRHTRVIHMSNSTVPTLRLSGDSTPRYDDMQGLLTSREDELWVSGNIDQTSLVLKDRKRLLSEVGLNTTPGSLSEALAVENVYEQRLQRLTQRDWKPPTNRLSSSIGKIITSFSERDPSSTQPNPATVSSFPASYPAWLGQTIPASANPRVLLISNQVPASELLAIAVAWSTVEAIVYDFTGSTPDSLMKQVEALLGHRMAKSFGIVPSPSESCLEYGFPLTGNCYISPSELDSPNNQGRRFFCALGALLLPRASGGDGHVDLFAPLMIQADGAEILTQLNAATGIVFHCPQTVRSEYEYMFGNCDWIVTKALLGLLESSQQLSGTMLTIRSGTGTYKAGLNTLSEKAPPKLYFEENRLAFWLKSYRLLHRAVGKIRHDLARCYEFRTESCLLDRLVGQVAFDEFQGTEFTHVMSFWPEISQAISSVTDPGLGDSGRLEDDDESQIEWRMAQVQQPTVAIASKLLEQAGYAIRETVRNLKQDKSSQAQRQLQNQTTQTMSMVLTVPTNQGDVHDASAPKQGDAHEATVPKQDPEPNAEKLSSTEEHAAVTSGESSDEHNKILPLPGAEPDADSLLLGEKGEPVTFGGNVGEGESNSSSGVISSAHSDSSLKDDYPLHHSSGIRPLEVMEKGAGGVPVSMDISWTIERSRLRNDSIGRSENKSNTRKARMVYSVLFTESDRRLIAAKDLFECESRYNKILAGVQSAFVYPLNQAVFQERAILSTNNIKLLFSDLLQLMDISNEFIEALETRLENWVDVDGQISDVILTFVCGRWNIFLSYMNNYPVLLETLDRCCDEQRLFRSFIARNERSLSIRMLSMAEVFALPFDQLAQYRSHFKRIAAHTDPSHVDSSGLREARKLMTQYCSLVSERVAAHTKHPQTSMLESSYSSLSDELVSLSSLTLLPNAKEISSDLSLLRDCPFNTHGGSSEERRFVCRQDVTLMRPASGRKLPFALQLFEIVDELGLFLFSDCLVVSKRRATHRPYVREADIAFYYSNCVPTRNVLQIDLPDTKYISSAVEYLSNQYKWLVCFPDQQSKIRFMAVIMPYVNAQLPTA